MDAMMSIVNERKTFDIRLAELVVEYDVWRAVPDATQLELAVFYYRANRSDTGEITAHDADLFEVEQRLLDGGFAEAGLLIRRMYIATSLVEQQFYRARELYEEEQELSDECRV